MKGKRILAPKLNDDRPHIIRWEQHTLSNGKVIELPSPHVTEKTMLAIGQEAQLAFQEGARDVLQAVVAHWIAYLNGFFEYGEFGYLGGRVKIHGVDITSNSGPYELGPLERKLAREAARRVQDALTAVIRLENSIAAVSLDCMAEQVFIQLHKEKPGTDDRSENAVPSDAFESLHSSDHRLKSVPPSKALASIKFVLERSVRAENEERRFAESEFVAELLRRVLALEMQGAGKKPSKKAFLVAVNHHVLIPMNTDPLLRASSCKLKEIEGVAIRSIDTAMKASQRGGTTTAATNLERAIMKLNG